MYTQYYYTKQIKKFITQFCNIFTGLEVRTGLGKNGEAPRVIKVPIRYGSSDRVVSSISAHNTQNATITLPMTSAYLTGIEMTPERRKGVGMVTNTTIVENNGQPYPNNIKVLKRYMPIPYNLSLQLSIYASSTDEMFQILEQILLIFDPFVQIQKSDEAYDWTKLTSVELIGINNEENYPMAQEKRVIQWSLDFVVPIWISPPAEKTDEYVSKIKISIANADSIDLQTYNSDGELEPFDTNTQILADIEITA